VATLAQGASYTTPGYVGVQEQPHSLSAACDRNHVDSREIPP
jgi:hypothetical protein